LFRTSPVENYVSLSWSVIISVTAFSTLFFLFLVTMGLRAQRSKPASGVNTMIGQTALTLGDLNPAGQVSVLGEIWKAVSLSGKIPENEKVTVKEIKELTLYVEPENKQV